ncbi:MAG: hypothetical protein KC613_27350 [Myxococcales bacterium]|nr:hypothetical protein [Myxococcales bacterium]MCB9523748.1 hypothetical protein [Myxococcales bacterium]
MRTDRRWAAALALTAFGFFGLTTGAERPWGDGHIQYRLAEQLWTAGRVDLPEAWSRYAFPGPDGRHYSTFSLGVALSLGPSVLATRVLAPDEHPRPLWALAHRTANGLWAALTLALFFLLARTLAVPRRRALGGAVVLGVATQLWVYAHSDFSEAYQAFALLLAVFTAVRAVHGAGRGRDVALGLAWGHLLIAKVVYLAVAPLGLWYVWRGLRGDPRRLRRLALAVAVSLPFVAAFFGYNLVRTGEWLGTGRQMDHFAHPMAGSLLVGLYGLLLSTGKGVLFFDPALLLSLAGARPFARQWPAEARFVGLLAGALLLIYAKYVFWHGAWSYGPRFLTCLMPLAVLPLLWRPPAPTRARRWAVGAVLAVSVGVQALGCAIYEGHHIHANTRLRRAVYGEGPRDTCAWCHENHWLAHFVPHASPIAVHAWAVKHALLRSPPATRAADAPWAWALPPRLAAQVEPIAPPTDFVLRRREAGHPKGLAALGLALLCLLAGAGWLRRQWGREGRSEGGGDA